MSVPGDSLTAFLPYLNPYTRYEVNIYAHYEKGESLPVTGYQTTLEGIYTVINNLFMLFFFHTAKIFC